MPGRWFGPFCFYSLTKAGFLSFNGMAVMIRISILAISNLTRTYETS